MYKLRISCTTKKIIDCGNNYVILLVSGFTVSFSKIVVILLGSDLGCCNQLQNFFSMKDNSWLVVAD